MKEWMIKTATILFDDSKNDLRTKDSKITTTDNTIICVVNGIYFICLWSIYAHIWTSLVIGHIAIIIDVYYTFKQFHNVTQNRYKFGTYHSYGRGRDYVIYRDKHGNM